MIRATRRAILGVPLLPAAARAQDWPARSARIIVPFPPGGPSDIVARMFAAHLQAAIGRPFAVENRAGAGGVIGMEAVARATPDGTTLGMANIASNAILAVTRRQPLPYDPIRDFSSSGWRPRRRPFWLCRRQPGAIARAPLRRRPTPHPSASQPSSQGRSRRIARWHGRPTSSSNDQAGTRSTLTSSTCRPPPSRMPRTGLTSA
jgi:hypothetical protein